MLDPNYDEQNRAKREALDTWVKGVNVKGGFGEWCWDVAFEPAQIHDIIATSLKGTPAECR